MNGFNGNAFGGNCSCLILLLLLLCGGNSCGKDCGSCGGCGNYSGCGECNSCGCGIDCCTLILLLVLSGCLNCGCK